MKKISLIVLLGLLSNAYADSKYYYTLGAGFDFGTKSSRVLDNSSYAVYGPTSAPSGVSIFNLPNISWENKYTYGFNVNTAVGFNITSVWHTDVEFIYQRLRREVTGTYGFVEYDAVSLQTIDYVNSIAMAPSNGYANVYSLMTNIYRDFDRWTWRPYISGGFGIAWMNAYSTTAPSSFTTSLGTVANTIEHSPKISGTALALQFKTGFNLAAWKATNIKLQYRFFLTSNFIANRSSIITNPYIPGATRHFMVSEQTIRGLMTSSFEIIFNFPF